MAWECTELTNGHRARAPGVAASQGMKSFHGNAGDDSQTVKVKNLGKHVRLLPNCTPGGTAVLVQYMPCTVYLVCTRWAGHLRMHHSRVRHVVCELLKRI